MTVYSQQKIDQRTIRWWPSPLFWGALLLGLVIGGLGVYLLQMRQIPGENSADVGFARDMSVHHAQAVEMASLLYERTDDENMRLLAYDILTTQQGQIGIMSGWLDGWGHNWTTVGPRMAWMGMPMTGLMPGMATAEELNRLRAAEADEADIIFLQLMIPHHYGGIEMAQVAAEQAQSSYVRQMADSMAAAQTIEIDYMQRLLQEKGQMPMPDESHSDMPHTVP